MFAFGENPQLIEYSSAKGLGSPALHRPTHSSMGAGGSTTTIAEPDPGRLMSEPVRQAAASKGLAAADAAFAVSSLATSAQAAKAHGVSSVSSMPSPSSTASSCSTISGAEAFSLDGTMPPSSLSRAAATATACRSCSSTSSSGYSGGITAASAGPPGRQLARQQTLGGALPPPVFEVNVTDRAFVPSLVTVEPGRRIRYRVQAGGDLNHMLQVDVDGYDPSPLLRPGMNWILDTSRLPIGTTSVRDEVTMMKGNIVLVEPPSLSNPGKGGAQGGGDGGGDDENADGEVAVQVPQAKERDDESDEDGDAINEQINNFLAGLKQAAPPPRDADEDEDDEDWTTQRGAFHSRVRGVGPGV